MPKLKQPMRKKLEKSKERVARSNGSVWKGPYEDGVTQSLLAKFMICRERFRLLTVEGLRPVRDFNPTIEFGQMWHVCEEALGQNKSWEQPLREYAKELIDKHRTQQEQIEKWYEICRRTFPIYLRHWEKHKDTKSRTPVVHEEVFDIPYKLPDRRTVRLRGKWDGVDIIGKGKRAAVYLQENKTKGNIDEQAVSRQLTFDLQSMLYLTALRQWLPGSGTAAATLPVGGVRYNVVRRPLGGGRHSIRQHKPTKSNPRGETKKGFYHRLAGLIASEPEYFFMRWRVEVPDHDLDRFERRCLQPLLMQMCSWWETLERHEFDVERVFTSGQHWQHPYGLYNPLNEGKTVDIDEYILNGNKAGLEQVTTLFSELQ